MLFELLKMLLLVKKYFLILIIFAVGTPIYIIINIDLVDRGFWGFFITVLFLEYVLFSIVSRTEDKYKGHEMFYTTPYARNAIVEAKYLFVLVIFVCTYIIYTVTALAAHIVMDGSSIFHFGISLLIITIYFAIIIPFQYQFGYEETRFISLAFVFVLPLAASAILKWFCANNISLQTTIPFSQVTQYMFLSFLALAIGLISMSLSIRIYAKKNLY